MSSAWLKDSSLVVQLVEHHLVQQQQFLAEEVEIVEHLDMKPTIAIHLQRDASYWQTFGEDFWQQSLLTTV